MKCFLSISIPANAGPTISSAYVTGDADESQDRRSVLRHSAAFAYPDDQMQSKFSQSLRLTD
jgi:hypothetical protein